jgi:hypothetical protein
MSHYYWHGGFLREEAVLNSKRVSHAYLRREDIERFRVGHVTLKDLAAEFSFGTKHMKAKLDEVGIQPIGPRRGLERFYYRRVDVADYLRS